MFTINTVETKLFIHFCSLKYNIGIASFKKKILFKICFCLLILTTEFLVTYLMFHII